MLSTNVPFVLRFQLNEQQQVKTMRVTGTDRYGEEWAGGISDCHRAGVEGQCLLACGVDCLDLEALD